MRTCYVSIPFGKREEIDYDTIYRDIVLPAVREAGFDCHRGDEFETAPLLQKAIMQSVLSADVMVADVSNHNPNVMYELGIRHAIRRGITVVISSGRARLPFNISSVQTLYYQLGPDGTMAPEAASEFRDKLLTALRRRGTSVMNDSPLYEYFPTLRVELPEELRPPDVTRPAYQNVAEARQKRGPDRKSDVARTEEATRGAVNVDPQAHLEILRRYRDLSAWPDVLRYADSLPADLANSPQVVQTVAHALTGLGQVDRAIERLEGYVASTGGDSESHGLLGRILKKRYFSNRDPADLLEALKHYQSAFKEDPQNLYLGRNLAMLLQREASADSQSKLGELLPRVRQLAEEHLASAPVPDYWDAESALILSVLARDWQQAQSRLRSMLESRPETWAIEATRDELAGIAETLTGADQAPLHELLALLNQPAESEEADA